MATQSAIIWPEKFKPGTTDNYVSNEVIAANLSATQIWPLLTNITKWESYYSNVAEITPPSSGNFLNKAGERFSFSTFGFPAMNCSIEESVAPSGSKAGRLAWRAWLEGDEDSAVDVYHAWVVEDLDGGRVRILTQESQIGKAIKGMAVKKPNPMLNGHQDWLDGLVKAARGSGQ